MCNPGPTNNIDDDISVQKIEQNTKLKRKTLRKRPILFIYLERERERERERVTKM